jgi:dipeptidyl aminopeptidase/acylaminoacyl peptidase
MLRLNEYLAGITLGRDTLMTYVGTDGDSLRALVTLPVGYQPGQRYPVVVEVYAGSVYRDTVVHPTIVEVPIPLHLQMLAAHGYAVLEPSIPLPGGGDAAIDLTKGVMPAVDKLIEIGIADPNRVAVFGHSFGGYTTYALVAYTHRFKAAIASAGTADLVSEYGTFSTKTRYLSEAMDDPDGMMWSEFGQVGMQVSPWENLWRYLRNSPLMFADRISTPLLIIQGDQDFVPMMQGEEMFSALYRQGKRARFVRYWGEGHSLSSPANIRDLWKEIYEWLDTYVTPAPSPKDAK